MPRMLDLVRASALPSHQMMTAARGALRLGSEETLEILVYLAKNNKIFGEQARLTLAGWEETSARAIAARSDAPPAVLDYWLSVENLRPAVFTALLENPAISIARLAELGTTLRGEWLDLMLGSPRVRGSRQVLEDLRSNKQLSSLQAARVEELLTGRAPEIAHEDRGGEKNEVHPPGLQSQAGPGTSAALPQETGRTTPGEAESEQALAGFLAEHAEEIAAVADKPFQPIGPVHDEIAREPQVERAAAAASQAPAVAPRPGGKSLPNPHEEQRGSVLQKIAKLDVKGRVQLAMKGTKEERSILVRDGTKIVALAVLDSPKITDGEVEKFASQKNVLEAFLRAIPLKRRFAKNYAIVRNLVFNPRTPIDLSLALMKNLLVQDLRHLCGNKEVADTVRKLALRMFRQKTEFKREN